MNAKFYLIVGGVGGVAGVTLLHISQLYYQYVSMLIV